MPPFANRNAVADYYHQSLLTHNQGPRAVGWNTSFTQLANFLQMCRVEGLHSGVSVLDVGCGLADFKGFLDQQGIHVQYTGIDICPAMIERAATLHPDAILEVRDILNDPPHTRFDFVFCSGTLNMQLPQHLAWVHAMLQAMYDLCRKALVFNALNAQWRAKHPEVQRDETYAYADPQDLLHFCQTLSPQVVLDLSGPPRSFHIHVMRQHTAPVNRLRKTLIPPGTDPSPQAIETIFDYYLELDLLPQSLDFLASLPPTAQVYNLRGIVATLQQDLDAATAAYEQALALDDSLKWAHLNRASIAHQRGQLQHAIASYQRTLQLDPSEATAQEGLCLALLQHDDLDAATQAADSLEDHALRAYLHGEIAWRRQAFSDAINAYKQALTLSPSFLLPRKRLAIYYEANGDTQQALLHNLLILEHHPDNNDAILACQRLQPPNLPGG